MPGRYRIFLNLVALFLALTLASHCGAGSGSYELVWYDDMEGDVSGWSHEDLTVGVEFKFHIDTYLAFDDPLHETDYSWWCGTFDYDADGGYGNGWDQQLNLPPVVVAQITVENISWGAIKALYRESGGREPQDKQRSGRPAVYPVLTFAYRFDSEPGYDYTYVQAESLGLFLNLNNGYDGTSNGWLDYGTYGFVVAEYDDPLMLRFRFISDGAWSDEDGLYTSHGGAFHVDNIKVYDFYGGTVYFFDDVQDGSLCSPSSVPEAAGDYWHLVDRKCPAYSDPHSWWCGDDADTSLIPPNLNNALYSPLVAPPGAGGGPCTFRYMIHAEVPTVDDDYWIEFARFSSAGTWYQLGGWWGDFGACDGWGTSAQNGWDLTPFFDGVFQMKIVFRTTDNGCGPGAAGGAGIFIDDCWLGATVYSRGAVGGLGTENLAAGQERLRALRARRQTTLSIPESPYRRF